MKITLYDILKDWENKPDIKLLVKRGVIPLVVLDYLTIFEYWKNTVGGEMDRKQAVMEEFNVSQNTVYRAIRMFE